MTAPGGAGWSGRKALPEDAGFLAALYLSARPDLQGLPVPRSVIQGIARHQQHLQRQDYALRYPDAEEWVIEAGKLAPRAAVGRLVLHRSAAALRVVDLSVAPHARRRGHARAVLAWLQAEAQAARLALRLRVRRENHGARALYAKMGFVTVADYDAALELRWAAPGQNE
ncbi:GNAT family N-acetyltransferase [Massilia niastensis]|uniref:GNAT family N-acetyltransferase n=1 Tax=Massilia niastensis TaxID=544911 RepID=UPI0003804C62|nr:GNAT family N-acetyltransferase [Massilia niastensis]